MRQRWTALLAILAVALSYATLVRIFDRAAIPTETSFGQARPGVTPLGVRAVADAISVDASARTLLLRMEMRVTGAPGIGPVTVTVDGGGATREVRLRPGDPDRAADMRIDLETGSVAAFPRDRYGTELRITAAQAGSTAPLPVQAILRDALASYTMVATAHPGGSGLTIALTVGRSLPVVLFVVAFYAIMALIGVITLGIGLLGLLRVRKIELAMTSLFATAVFAVPALRNALPGAPPLGVRADYLVFLWSEAAIVGGLALFVVTWIRDSFRSGTLPAAPVKESPHNRGDAA